MSGDVDREDVREVLQYAKQGLQSNPNRTYNQMVAALVRIEDTLEEVLEETDR